MDAFLDLEQKVITCKKCPRLVSWREEVGRIKRKAFRDEAYWAKPVPAFGDPTAKVLVVGLAPGAHGSNRTGRMFTGDASGNFLFPALHRAGFANQPQALGCHDGLKLHDVLITAVCRCVPPGNKPTPQEIDNCFPFLLDEINMLSRLEGIVALGRIAYDVVTRVFYDCKWGDTIPDFSHGCFFNGKHAMPWLMGSYHPSRQNTQTGRLTITMFDQVWEKVGRLLR